MTNFCGAEFLPNYATLTHELRQLTKKKKNTHTQWSWTERHTECLKNIKEALSRACSLAYFDPNKHTEIHTDASPVGISAVLSQNGRIVQFASRAQSAVEQRYSQTSNAPTTKRQRTKNSRGIYKLHPLNLNLQSNEN